MVDQHNERDKSSNGFDTSNAKGDLATSLLSLMSSRLCISKPQTGGRQCVALLSNGIDRSLPRENGIQERAR